MKSIGVYENHFAISQRLFPGFIVLQDNYLGDKHERYADSRRFDSGEGC